MGVVSIFVYGLIMVFAFFLLYSHILILDMRLAIDFIVYRITPNLCSTSVFWNMLKNSIKSSITSQHSCIIYINVTTFILSLSRKPGYNLVSNKLFTSTPSCELANRSVSRKTSVRSIDFTY